MHFDNEDRYWEEISEEEFRKKHDWIEEHKSNCCNLAVDKNSEDCPNTCHWLASGDVDSEGEAPVFGIDCEATFLCWSADPRDVAAETYCNECVKKRRKVQDHINSENAERNQRAEEEAKIERKKNELANIKNRIFWENLTPNDFESACGRLFQYLGYEVEPTAITNDGGVDIHLRKGGRNSIVQCKYTINPTSVREIREFYGVMTSLESSRGYFLSKSGATNAAMHFISGIENFELWNLEKIVSVATSNRFPPQSNA